MFIAPTAKHIKAPDFDALPRFHTYAEALTFWENVPPVKVGTAKVVPLGRNRDAAAFSIEHQEDEMLLCLFGYPYVRIKKDDTFALITDYWDQGEYGLTFSTRFLNATTPFRVYRLNYVVVIDVGDHKYVVPRPGDGLHDGPLLIQDDAIPRVLNPPQYYYWKINRKAARQVRKPYQDFIHFVKSYCAMCIDEHGFVLFLHKERPPYIPPQKLILQVPTAPVEEYYDLMCELVISGRATPADALNRINNWINFAHGNEVLERVPQAIGTLPQYRCRFEAWPKPDTVTP